MDSAHPTSRRLARFIQPASRPQRSLAIPQPLLDERRAETDAGFELIKRNYRRELTAALHQFDEGQSDAEELDQQVRRTLRRLFLAAFLLGHSLFGGDEEINAHEAEYLAKALERQFAFWADFWNLLQQAQAEGKSLEPFFDRLGLYAESARGAYSAGLVFGLPEETEMQIYWVLGQPKTGHCDDCVRLAAASPYRPGQLHQFPGDGRTACLSFCHCHLEFRSK